MSSFGCALTPQASLKCEQEKGNKNQKEGDQKDNRRVDIPSTGTNEDPLIVVGRNSQNKVHNTLSALLIVAS